MILFFFFSLFVNLLGVLREVASGGRQVEIGRWVREGGEAGWKVGAAAASGMGKLSPGARKGTWALRVASQACPEDEDVLGGVECHVSRGVKEGSCGSLEETGSFSLARENSSRGPGWECA